MYTLIRTALTHVRNIPCVFINKPHNTNRFTASSQCDTFLDLSQQKGFIGDVNIGTEHGKGDVVQERGEAFDSYVEIVHPKGLNLVKKCKDRLTNKKSDSASKTLIVTLIKRAVVVKLRAPLDIYNNAIKDNFGTLSPITATDLYLFMLTNCLNRL